MLHYTRRARVLLKQFICNATNGLSTCTGFVRSIKSDPRYDLEMQIRSPTNLCTLKVIHLYNGTRQKPHVRKSDVVISPHAEYSVTGYSYSVLDSVFLHLLGTALLRALNVMYLLGSHPLGSRHRLLKAYPHVQSIAV